MLGSLVAKPSRKERIKNGLSLLLLLMLGRRKLWRSMMIRVSSS